MTEINEKDLEQAAGGRSYTDKTPAELLGAGYTRHRPYDVENCPEYVHEETPLWDGSTVSALHTCSDCKYALFTPQFEIYCTKKIKPEITPGK